MLRGLTAAFGLLAAGGCAPAVEKNKFGETLPFETPVIQSGHSLTDPIPAQLEPMIVAAGGPKVKIDRSTSAGSPMTQRWREAPDYGMPDARARIGDYKVLVLTERVPLSNTVQFEDSSALALRWFKHAWAKGDSGRGAETILYATWVGLDSGPEAENPYKDPEGMIPWRERLPLEQARWEEIRDYVNKRRPDGSPEMRLIPGPLIMAAAYDAIAAGTAPLGSINELFSDDIHLNDAGAHLVALAHFAVIYGRDPRSLPDAAGDGSPSPDVSRWMKELVWKVLDAQGAVMVQPDV